MFVFVFVLDNTRPKNRREEKTIEETRRKEKRREYKREYEKTREETLKEDKNREDRIKELYVGFFGQKHGCMFAMQTYVYKKHVRKNHNHNQSQDLNYFLSQNVYRIL